MSPSLPFEVVGLFILSMMWIAGMIEWITRWTRPDRRFILTMAAGFLAIVYLMLRVMGVV